MKRKIALFLVLCMMTSMIPTTLAEELMPMLGDESTAIKLSDEASDPTGDDTLVISLGDVAGIQLGDGGAEQGDAGDAEDAATSEADGVASNAAVQNANPASVPSKLKLGVKQTYTLEPSKIAKGETVTFKSSKTAVATVSKKGVITAVATGSSTISAVVNKKTVASCTVTVVKAPTKVTLPDKSVQLSVKGTYQIVPKLPEGTMASFTYSSDDKKIASVTEDGLVTGLKEGKTTITVNNTGKVTAVDAGSCTITVTTGNGKKATCAITVKKAPSKVALNLKKVTLTVGASMQLTATLPKGSTSDLTWSSDKPSVVKVNESGLITAVKAGNATITVKTYNGKTDTCAVAVNKKGDSDAKLPSKVTLEPSKATLSVNDTFQLTATLPNGTSSVLEWSSRELF